MDERPVGHSQLPPPTGDGLPGPAPLARPLPPPAPWTGGEPANQRPSDDDTTEDWTGGAITAVWDHDDTPALAPLRPGARHGVRARWFSEDAFQNLRRHLSTLALAVALAAPVAVGVFIALASLVFAVDDRSFWSSQGRSLVRFWYVLVFFVVAITPVSFSALRRGISSAGRFVVDRGYWKVLLIAIVGLPLLGALVMFVAGHLVAALVVLAALLLIVVITGGF